MAENKLLSLYNTLSTDPDLTEAGDNNFGSYDDFKEVMQDPHNIESVYNFVSKKGGYGTLDEFSASLQDTGDEVQTPDYDKGQQVKGDATSVSPDEPYAAYGGADEEPGYPQADYSKLNNTELAKRAEQSLTDMDSAVEHNDEEGYKSSLGDYLDVKSEMDLRKDDPIYLDLSSATDAQLQQLSSDDTLNDIEGRTDPNEKRAYLNQYLAAKSEVKKRADAARHAANVADVADVNAAADVARRREATRDPGGVDKERRSNVNRALNSYERLWRKYDDGSGKTTSSAEQGISKHYQRYNDNIRKARKMSDEQLWDNFETVMNTTYREGDTLKAVDAIPLMEEIVSREKGGGHAETIGERNAREFLYGVGGAGGNGVWRRYGDNSDVRNMEGSVAWHYDQFLQGGAGHVSDFNRDFDSTYRDVPIFAIAGKAVSLIDERLNAVAERYNNRWAIHSPGESVDLSEYRDAVKSMNITDAIKTAMSGYDKNKLLGYIAAFAEKNDLSIDEATARVNELIFEHVMDRESEAIAPKNEFDYWMRTVLTENFAAQMVKGAVALSAYRPGEVGAYHVEERAKADYLRTHADGFVNNAVTVSAELAKFVLDGYGGAFKLPGLFAKGAPLLLGGMTTAGTRALMRDGAKRFASGALGGALNFMAFQTEMESLRQLRLGDYSGMALLDAAVKGLGEGAVFGAVGGAFDRMFLNARGWQVPVGEALKFVGEGGTFATFGYLESGGNLTMKDLASSFGMALIPRMQHFSQWARDVDARFHGKNGYADKVRVHKISKAEQEDLEGKGYTYIAMALRGSALTKGDVEHLSRELDAMREDKEVPWEYVRMADWVLNGRIEVLPPVVKYIYEDTGESYSITPQDENGRAINGTFTTRSEAAFMTARRALDVAINQNNIRLAERAALSTSYERAIARAAIASCRPGEDAKAVYNIYRDAQRKVNAGEQLGEIERDIYDSVNAQLKDMTLVDEAAAYKFVLKRAGYDVDSILKKHPDEWTSQERMIIDKYEQWLSDAQIKADAANGQDFIAWAKGQTQREAATDGAVPVERREDVTEAERGGVDADAEMQSQLDAKLGDDIAEPHEPVARATEQPEPQAAENREGATTEGMPVRGTESAERVAERGAPAHYDDAVALYPSAKDLGGEDLEDLLYAMEIERNEAHRYANGEIDEKPENYDYWAARDGLVKNEASVEPEGNVASPGEPQPAEPQERATGENGEKKAENQISNAVQTALAAAEQETNTEPTEAQKEAGNYKKGHVKIDGYDVTIEQPKGSVRRGRDASGKQWEQEMQNTYGYIRDTEGVDGDHIGVFFSEDPSQGDVFVVDQVNKDGSFDEHKVMYGFPDMESARKAYLSNYEDGWQGLGAITPVSKEEFKKWIRSSHRKTKPFAEYSSVKPLGDTQLGEQLNKPTVKAGEVLPLAGNGRLLEVEAEKSDDDTHVGYSRTLQSSDGTLQRSVFYDGKLVGVQWLPGERLAGVHDIMRAAYGEMPEENFDLFVPQFPGENDAWKIDGRDVIDFDHGDAVRFHSEKEMTDFYLRNRQEIDRRNDRFTEPQPISEGAGAAENGERPVEAPTAEPTGTEAVPQPADAQERGATVATTPTETIGEVEGLAADDPYNMPMVNKGGGREADEEQMRADVAARDAALRQGEEQDGGVQFRAGERDGELSGAGHVERVRGWAANTDRALGTRTRVVTYDELPASVRRQVDAMERRGVRTTGFFDPATGETVVIADRVSSEGEAVATVWHENVGHKGMEQMLGNRYGEWLDRVSELARGEHGQLWTDLAQRYSAQYDAGTDAGRRGLASEFIAEAAERRVSEPSLWARVRGMARRFLIENFNVRMTDADLDYMLWKAAKQVRKSNGLALMRERAEEALLKKRAEDEWKEFMTTWHGSGNDFTAFDHSHMGEGETRPTFYSNAERAVENVKQNKATAEQWKAMLTKGGGIKVGEVELNTPGEEVMHSVDVTPEMKESVMQGQPLFREKLAEGGTLKIERVTPPGSRETVSYITGQRMRVPDGEGEWRIEGMPGTYPSREAALDAFRNRTQGSVLWDISRDGERIHILGAGDAFEALRGGGAKQTERLARWQQQREADGREQINALGEHMGINVKYVDDMSDAERAGLSERQQAAKGWFNPDTGEIFINLHNHHRSSDMVATMLHEAVGHKGLRDLFGDDFDTFLDNVWGNVKLPIGDELRRRRDALLAREGNTLNAREAQRLAVEEYMSEFAEEGRFDTEAKATLWQRFKGWLTVELRKLGFNGVLSDEDLRYVLWKSYQNQLKQGEMIAKAKDVAMRNKLGIGKDDAVVAAESRRQEFQDTEPRGGDSGLRFRASGVGAPSERDVVLSDVPRITDENRDNKDVRVAAMKAIGGNLSKLRQAMSKQRTYDRETVKLVTDFAKQMIDNGLLSGMSDYEAKQVLTKIKNATGKEDITNDVNKLVDLMIKHQLKAGKVTFAGLLDTKPSRVDSRGIVVAAGLDDKGARTLNAVKAGLTLDPDALIDRINDVVDKLDDPSDVVRENADAEYDGLMIAQRYLDTVKQRESYEAQYKQMFEDAKAQHKNGQMSNTDYKQYKQAVEEQMRDNRIGLIEDYGTLAEALGFGIESSKERLKQWRDEQRLRAEEIRHDANRDMQGADADIHMKPKRGVARVKGAITDSKLPGAIQRVLLSPLGTFDTYMRYFGRKFADGAGNLYNRFVRGGIDAQDSEWKAYKADISALDRKARELFGKDAVDLYRLQNSKNKIKVHTKTGDYDLTQLQAAYIYCVNKQADGRMKLRSMGIDESEVQAIADKINPNIIKFFDWAQEDFLPGMRERLNETHKRMYGASMDNIVGYFPLRINMLDVPEKETLSAGSRPSTERTQTSVGGIMKRTINNKALDITRVDALQVLLEHIREMEHWNSFAELSRDLNTLLSYKRFKTQVINSTSLRYGNGKNMWEDFVKCAQIVTGNYTPSTGKFNTDVADFTSAWAASNIAFRFWTAMKQFQSGIVGATQANWWYLTKDLTKVLSYGADNTWNWAIANLPTFAERWQSRKMGDTSLDAIDIQRGGKKALSRFVSNAARIGITPNAAIDGLTVAMLGRAIYETRLRKYKRWGYDDATCERRALQDAAISVNETQQSSQGLFKSVLQTDRDVLSRVASMYRNASMGYQRMAVRGIKSVENSLSPKWRAEAYRVTKDMAMRDGLSEPQAERMAKSVVRREFFRGIANMVMFGAIAPITWAGMGKLLPMLFTGQDDDKQVSEEVNKSLVHGISGFVEGLVGGATFGDMAEFLYDLSTDEDAKVSDARLPENDPLLGELRTMKQKASGKPYEAAYDLANLFFSATTGVNPETFVNWYAAISDYYHGDMDTTREALLLAARILNMPESATQKVYVDELMTTSDEAKKLSAEEFAARYARYKRLRGAGYMNLFSSDEADASVEEKYIKKYDTMLQERLGDMDANQLSEIATDGADEKLSRAATKSYYKQSGVEYHAKTSAGGQLYERSRTAQDIASDVTVRQYDAKLSEVKKAWEAAGGKIGKRGGGYDTYADEDADRVKLDALYKQYRKELKALVNLHIYSEHDKKWMRELGKDKADKSAIMEEKRRERGQLLDALKTLVGDAN